jgi:hypothetical protein
MSYNVVFETIFEGSHNGVTTWTSFESKEKFEKWNDEKMKSWYKVLAEGVTPEQAVEICSSPKAKLAALLARLKEACEIIKNI